VPRIAEALAEPKNELWLSPVSLWETSLLIEDRELAIGRDGRAWIEQALASFPLRDAPFTREVVLVSREVGLPHQDPADRFIAASAIVHGLTLVTRDRHLLACDEYERLSAR
jgi:PIN domain nuclease of toxin-antitoxin system